MAERFGEENVVVVGTVAALQLKGVIKEYDRLHDNNVPMANLITSTIDGVKDKSVKDLFNRAVLEPKLKHYIQENSDAFHMLPSVLGQQKSKSIHACACIITPTTLSTEEWMPVREQNGVIISEWSGYELDEAGFLKNDVLGLLQLDKFADILDLIQSNGKEVPNIYDLPHDEEVYRYFSNGWNGDVFQMGTDSLSDYTKLLKPEDFNDLSAVVALYRPGPMENGIHLDYAKRKNEGAARTSLWGTAEETKDTYGLIVYQEQVMKICQNAGGLTENEADDVRRAMGKKKADVLKSSNIPS
jgi:DNA polymerase-3 subunit alpha